MRMVTDEDVKQMAAMMRLDIGDGGDYTRKVQRMLAYFDVLDSAGVEDETILVQHIRLSQLRQDVHVRHRRIECRAENERGQLRAPRLG